MNASAEFDPYRKWLGIPAKDQPPTHYRLLGIEIFEDDPDVIESAADGRMAHVRTFQTGRRSELSQKILNELSIAKVCLLDLTKKNEYDAWLHSLIEAQITAQQVQQVRPVEASQSVVSSVTPRISSAMVSRARGGRSGRSRKRNQSALVMAIIGGVAAAAILLGIVYYVSSNKGAVANKPGTSTPGKDGNGGTVKDPAGDLDSRLPGHPVPPFTGPNPGGPDNPGGSGIEEPDPGHVSQLPDADPHPDNETGPGIFNLFELIEPTRDSLSGRWEFKEEQGRKTLLGAAASEALSIADNQVGELVLPVQLGQYYRLSFEGQRLSGSGDILLGFHDDTNRPMQLVADQVLEDGEVFTSLDSHTRGHQQAIKEKVPGDLFAIGESRNIDLLVLADGVSVNIDGQPAIVCHRGEITKPDSETTPSGDAEDVGEIPGFGPRPDRDVKPLTRKLYLKIRGAGSFQFTRMELERFAPEGEIPILPERAIVHTVTRLLPVPSPDEQDAIRQAVDERYQKTLTDARRTRQHAEVSRLLIRDALEEDLSPAERFLVLEKARLFAAEVGDYRTGMLAVKASCSRYHVDPTELKVQTIRDVLESTDIPPTQRKLIFTQARELTDTMLAAEDFSQAAELAKLTHAAAKRTPDENLKTETTNWAERIQAIAKERPNLVKAMALLKETPDDSLANYRLGKHFCFLKEDWDQGLPYLARATASPKILDAATADLANPADPNEQVAVGDKWFALAEVAQKQQALGIAPSVRARGVFWYQKALPHLTGETLRRIEIALRREAPASSDEKKLAGFDCRKPEHRERMLEAYGGDQQTENAVIAALEWLALHQNKNGSWSYDHTTSEQCDSKCPHAGSVRDAPLGATATALLPFVGYGINRRDAIYYDNLSDGLSFLKEKTHKAGSTIQQESMYSLSRVGLFFSDACVYNRDKKLLPQVRSSVQTLVRSQSPKNGGWSAATGLGSDTKLFLWQISLLKTADWGKLSLPDLTRAGTVDKATRYLKSIGDIKDGQPVFYGGCKHSGQVDREKVGPVYTAIGLLGVLYMNVDHNKEHLRLGVEHLVNEGPSDKDMLLNYCVTQLAFQYGGEPWKEWNPKIKQFLLENQAADGHATGSWCLEEDPSAATLGRLYHTALGAMILETYYRYPKIKRDDDAPAD